MPVKSKEGGRGAGEEELLEKVANVPQLGMPPSRAGSRVGA